MTEPDMKDLNLPEPMAAYFAADRQDAAAVARCFTNDAVVKDEGRTHTGQAAIEAWKAEASSQFTYAVKPHSLDKKGSTYIVTGRVTGNFPGSPVDLRYFFTLARGRISSLEIKP
jgi:ketosteroid isomerase-like protein